MVALVSSMMDRIVLPPGPMMAPIFSVSILMDVMRGAYWLRSDRTSVIASRIRSRMWSRPSRAWANASAMMAKLMPVLFMSIWSAVTPPSVPATLKSMSPSTSSMP